MDDSSTLVTGAAGFAGRHLIAHLKAAQPSGRLMAWSRQPSQSHGDDGVEWSEVDVTNREAVTNAMVRAQPDRIVHLAGSPHVGQSWANASEPLKTNVLGTHYLLEAVRTGHRHCRVLVVTSAMIYRPSGEPLDENAAVGPASPYGFSKLAQDQLALAAARQDGLDIVVARPFNHVGPGQDSSFFLSSFARQIALIEANALPSDPGRKPRCRA
jgi:GDP-4-dehydro-6-deoxy-D-mannose reductase